MAQSLSDSLDARFRERLSAFVFFHLGSDALVELEAVPGGLKVRLQHHRVEPFSFQLEAGQVERFTADAEAFEDFMLDLLTRYRR